MKQQHRNIVYLSDRGGTGKWRRIWPIQQLDSMSSMLNLQADYSQTPILSPDYYRGMTSVTIQRWISDQQADLVKRFLKPVCDANSTWLVYEIDDAMHYDEIPKYNRGRKAFEGEKIQQNIKFMLDAADFVTTTTDYIRDYYCRKYGLSKDKVIAVPNLLPKYLFFDRYDVEKKISQFKKFKAKPRIGIISSLSHYNVDDVRIDKDGKACRASKQGEATVWTNEDGQAINEADVTPITDDIDEILSSIRETVDDFQWVFFGFCPPKLKDLVDAKKIEVHPGTAIMNYASVVEQLQLQAIVAPIKDIEFNRCKSFIKYMEAAALGVPLYASNSLPYSRVMPEKQLFSSADELKSQLLNLKFMSTGLYEKIIKQQWEWLTSPHKEGDFQVKNFWLEDNIDVWVRLMQLRQKPLTFGLKSIGEQYAARRQQEEKQTIFKTESGMKIVK